MFLHIKQHKPKRVVATAAAALARCPRSCFWQNIFFPRCSSTTMGENDHNMSLLLRNAVSMVRVWGRVGMGAAVQNNPLGRKIPLTHCRHVLGNT